jgi:hypothetical protein
MLNVVCTFDKEDVASVTCGALVTSTLTTSLWYANNLAYGVETREVMGT